MATLTRDVIVRCMMARGLQSCCQYQNDRDKPVESLLGAFPRASRCCRDEALLRAYRNWQLSLYLSLLALLCTCISLLFLQLCFGRFELYHYLDLTRSLELEESWDTGKKQSSTLATPCRSCLRRASRRSGRIWSRAPRTCWPN
jgi:hypothetical protein